MQHLVDRTAAAGGIVFAAAERIQRGFALLKAGEEAGVSEDAHVLDAILAAYKDLAEGAFRTYGWLVADAIALHKSETLAEAADPPTLGPLEQRLAACGREAGERLAACCDSSLRNAVAHSQYRWDAECGEMHDLRTDQRWDVEELERASQAMVDAVVGTIVLAGAGPFDKVNLTAAVVGLRASAKSVDSIQVRAAGGELLLDVAGTSLDEFLEAKEEFKDLVCLAPGFSDWERTGEDRSRGLKTIAAMQVRLVVAGAEGAVDDPNFGPHSLLRVADRLGFVFEWVGRRKGQEDGELEPVLKHLRRGRAQVFAASQGNQQALSSVIEELEWLSQWSDQTGFSWPPENEPDSTTN